MSVGEFKSRFSEALDAVRKGESITVTFGRKKKAVAIVSPVQPKGLNVRWDCWPARRVSRLRMTGKSTNRSFWELELLSTPVLSFGWSMRLSG